MEARAVARYIGVSPQKARLVVDRIRGRKVDEALAMLELINKAVSRDVSKVLRSAVANAENTKNLDVDRLYVKKAFVDQGPSQKRLRARAMGRGNVIKRRTSHITIVVEEAKEGR
ncbi:MAG TPA: 50S ribosomal protein L22 [Deltaproteobacteria bacterium]|nr:50S ribosomal protein L22 [Deltaproteobacteria bacterium]